jgi:hypothetical protein
MNGLRQVGRDLRRIAHGIKAFVRYLVAEEDCEVGLGLLSATSRIARRGQASQYVVRIANVNDVPREVLLALDIKMAERPAHHERHYASFTKHLTLGPRTARTVTIAYDWLSDASFSHEGYMSPPDDFWEGTGDTGQLYALTALLSDLQRRQLDRLTVYQELTG